MSSSLIGSLLKLESQLQCDLCHNLVNDARTLNECGHRFCRGCVYDRIGVERTCPTCHLPAIVKNLRPDPMHDTLVACVRKLGTLLVGGTPSVDTHGLLSENNSMEQAGDPMHRHRLQESSGLLQMARDTSNDKGTTRSEWMDSQPQNDTDRSLSGTKMYETSPISLLQPVQEFPSMSPHMPQTPSEMEDQTMSDEKHVPTHSAVADTLMETKTLSAVEQQRGAEEKVKDLTVGHDVFSSSVSSVSTTDAMLPSWLRDQLRNSVPPLNEDDAMSRPSLDSVGSESETVPLLRDWLRRSDSSDLVRFHRPAKGIIASVTRTPSPLQIDEGDLSPHGNDDDVDDTMSCDEQVTNGSEIGSSVATGQQTPSLLRDYLAAPFDYDEEEDTIMQEQPKEDPTPNNVQNTTNTADSHDHVSNKIKTPSTIPSSSKHDEQQQQQQYHPHSHFVNNNGINTTTTTPTQHSINHCNNYIGIQHQHEQQQQPPTATTAVVENDNNETDDNERYSAEALLKELDQSSLPDDELSFPEDERLPPPSNRTIAQVPVAVQPITHEEDDNNNDDNMSLLLQELLKDDGLPDDEIPSTSEKGKRKQSEKRKSIDRSNASSKAPISLPSPATTEEAVAPEALAETDIFSIDVPHPYSKRLRLSDPNDHSGSRIARNNNHPAQPSAAAATAADQQEQQQGPSITAAKEPWQCLHCQYMNPVTVETCGLCRKMRGSAPAVTISQSISSTPMTVTASVIPTSQEEQDYLAATRMRTFDAVRVMFTGIKTVSFFYLSLSLCFEIRM
ncbi:hypothetical protein BDB00DRAFT_564279 [Zychaea mexicana]|uniref:uncharacterized protein n=1 Tax=Zychaea mexicana TaxID=64656 RepID=UPI0022FDB9BD|nr:uncharacterized protein BDB00DRAFT_564279 [Zychaea mexicana]KAI9490250.1 hypothetical protein BDB00DRAFT_564279 [Zychaea mexicana]